MFRTPQSYSRPYKQGFAVVVITALILGIGISIPIWITAPLGFLGVIFMIKSRNAYGIHMEQFDAKTGALSRASLGELDPEGKLPRLFKGVAQNGKPLIGLFVDIDGFKEINSGKGGYEAGDRVLREVTQAMQKKFGKDKVIRLMEKSISCIGGRILRFRSRNSSSGFGKYHPRASHSISPSAEGPPASLSTQLKITTLVGKSPKFVSGQRRASFYRCFRRY